MSSWKRFFIFALAAAPLVAACDSTEPDETEDTLTDVEAAALFMGVQELVADTMPQIVSVAPGGFVVACPLGGQATVMAEVTESMTSSTTSTTLNPDGCVVAHAGQQFTLDGNPSIQMEITLTAGDSPFSFMIDGSISGGVDWQLLDRAGTCMVDLMFSGSPSDPASTQLSGTLCGHTPPITIVGPLVGG